MGFNQARNFKSMMQHPCKHFDIRQHPYQLPARAAKLPSEFNRVMLCIIFLSRCDVARDEAPNRPVLFQLLLTHWFFTNLLVRWGEDL